MDARKFSDSMENLANLLEGIYTCMSVRKRKKTCKDCPFYHEEDDDCTMCWVVYHATNYIIGD